MESQRTGPGRPTILKKDHVPSAGRPAGKSAAFPIRSRRYFASERGICDVALLLPLSRCVLSAPSGREGMPLTPRQSRDPEVDLSHRRTLYIRKANVRGSEEGRQRGGGADPPTRGSCRKGRTASEDASLAGVPRPRAAT